MTTRDQLNEERIKALLNLLDNMFSLSELREIQRSTQIGEAEQKVGQRQKQVDQIKADFQVARSDFDTAVSDYQAAGDTATRVSAVATAIQAQQSQIDEIVEYLVLTGDSL